MDSLTQRLRQLLQHDFFKLMGGSAYVFIFRIMGAASVYLTQVVIARWLGAEALGAYVYAFSWLVMLAVVSGFGFPAASYRFIGHALTHGEPGKIHGYIRLGGKVVLLGSVLSAVFAGLWAYWPGSSVAEDYRIPLLIGIATAPFMAMIIFRTAVAQAFSWFDLAVVPHDAVRPFVFLLLLALLWWLGVGFDVNDVMLLQFVVMGFFMVLIHILVTRRTKQKIEPATPQFETRLWMRTATPLLVIILFSGYFSEVNMIIVGAYLPPEDLAVFNAAFRTAFMIGFGITAVDGVTLPKASRLFAGGESAALQRLVTHATHLKFWGAVVAVAILALYGKPILSIFGEGFDQGYTALVVLGLAMMFIAGTGAVTELLSVSGYQDHCLYVFVAAFLMVLGLHSIFVPLYGIDGAAYSVLAVVIIYSSWLHWIVVRKLGILPSVFGILWLRKNDSSLSASVVHGDVR